MKCSYCSKDLGEGKGIMFVNKAGTISYFCTGTCFKNSKGRRKLSKNSSNKSKTAEAVAARSKVKKTQ
ncbi:MAG: 50S ribosomal protein L24 [Candidatus Marsarchaeota archaeon]|nr:50S ribosomal protein L24 [Candidatus Marsarchaeota archaeon]